MNYLSVTKFARPPVYATSNDLERLREFVRAAPRSIPGVDLLLQEIARMTPAPETSPDPYVRLDAPVRYKDLRTKRERQVRIVDPKAAEPDHNRISVLVPDRRSAHRPSPGLDLSLARGRWRAARRQGDRRRALIVLRPGHQSSASG